MRHEDGAYTYTCTNTCTYVPSLPGAIVYGSTACMKRGGSKVLMSHSICSQCSVTADGVCADAKQSCDTNSDKFFYKNEK